MAAQRNIVLKKKVLSPSIVCTSSQNFLSSISLQIHYTKQVWTIFHTASILVPPYNQLSLICNKVYCHFGHKQSQPNFTEAVIPQGSSNLTMELKVVYKFLALSAHTTPIYFNDMTFLLLGNFNDQASYSLIFFFLSFWCRSNLK